MNHPKESQEDLHIIIFRFLDHQLHSRIHIKGAAIGTIRGQGREHIADPQHPCSQRDFIPHEIGWIAAAVVVLMMIQDTLQNEV